MEKPNKQEGESLFDFAHPPVAEDAVVSQGGQMNLAEESDNSIIMKIFQIIQRTVSEELINVDEEDWFYNKENLPKNTVLHCHGQMCQSRVVKSSAVFIRHLRRASSPVQVGI